MAATDVLGGTLSETEHRAQLRKAVIASTVGTTIEWYDFLLYSIVTGLVFGKLFFPHSDPLVGVLEAFAIYFVGFVARPIGAVDLRPLRRPHRPQGGADRDPADHRPGDLRGRLCPRLRFDRHLGRGDPDRHPLHPGHRRRRRMGRLGAVLDGMGAHQQASRLHHLVAAIRRTGGVVSREHRGAGRSAPSPATSSSSGVGASRSCSASSWSGSGSISGSAFSRPRRSAASSPRNGSSGCRSLEVIKRQPKQVFLSMFARIAEQAPAYIYLAFVFAYGTAGAAPVARFSADGADLRRVISFFTIPLAGRAVRPLRPQADLHHRLGR